MAQGGDIIMINLQQELARGSVVDLPYPRERGPRNYKQGGAILKIPDQGKLLPESATTFEAEFLAAGIRLSYFSGEPIPAGCELSLEPAMAPLRAAAALTARGMVAAFGIVTAPVAAVAVAYASPYKAGDFRGPNPLSPVSVARIVKTGGDQGGGSTSGQFIMQSSLLARALGIEQQETRQIPLQVQQGVMSAILPRQETSQQLARDYDFGRIQAEIDELALRHRDHGMDRKPQDPNAGLPMQIIRDGEGNVLMKGHAKSIEHLIAIKLEEAAKSTNPEKQVVNLAGAQLDERTLGRKLNFNGFDFKNVDLRGANLGGAQFDDCKLENVDMQGANLKGCTFNMCTFKDVNLNEFEGDKHTKFSNCTLQGVTMANANAPQIRFENIRAEGVDMTGANFAGANISNFHVHNLTAQHVNLEGARIGELHVTGRHSTLDNAKLNGAQLAYSSFGTTEYGISMRGIQAQNATLHNVQFNASDLSGADFTRANFINVDMRRVVTPLGPMQMAGANLTGLNAGPEAKFTAYRATYGGVEMVPNENFVFRGIEPIKRASLEANAVNALEAHIKNADGATTEADLELEKKRTAEMQMQLQRRRQMAMAPAPPSPYKKKKGDNPW